MNMINLAQMILVVKRIYYCGLKFNLFYFFSSWQVSKDLVYPKVIVLMSIKKGGLAGWVNSKLIIFIPVKLV